MLLVPDITRGPAGPSCVKGDSRCSAENRKDGKLSCSATKPVLNRSSLKLACVIRSKGSTNLPNLVPIEQPVAPHGLLNLGKICSLCDFFFSGTRPGQTHGPILTHEHSTDSERPTDVPFGGYNHHISNFGGLRPQKPPKFRPLYANPSQNEKLNNFLTVRDRQKVVM